METICTMLALCHTSSYLLGCCCLHSQAADLCHALMQIIETCLIHKMVHVTYGMSETLALRQPILLKCLRT
jgi:hypothetical protein